MQLNRTANKGSNKCAQCFIPYIFFPPTLSVHKHKQRQTSLGTNTCAQVNMIHFLIAEWQKSKCQAVIGTTKSFDDVCTCVKEHCK